MKLKIITERFILIPAKTFNSGKTIIITPIKIRSKKWVGK